MYTLKQEPSARYTVLKDGLVWAIGFLDIESALHSVWVLEGKVYDHFYVVDADGVVACVDRGVL